MQHTLKEKLESINCRRDDKARRVLNVAPDTVAEITAEELENGVTLERLDSLSVPVLRYSGQLTIHGKLPAFNLSARPGGYKAVFRNDNGSVGVRYSAIDAPKKELIARACRAVAAVEGERGGKWYAHSNSAGFSVVKYFIATEYANSEELKSAVLACYKSAPVARFYGTAGVFALAYGMGYAVELSIGAIPAAELWPLIADLCGADMTETRLAELEAKREAEEKAKREAWEKECAERAAVREAADAARRERFAAFMAARAAAGGMLAECPRHDGAEFLRYGSDQTLEDAGNPGTFRPIVYRLSKRGGRLCYSRDGETWKTVVEGNFAKWDAAAKAGRIFAAEPAGKPVADGEGSKAEAARSEERQIENPDGPASQRQTFALYCATGRDFRGAGLSRGKASELIRAVSHLRGNKPAARAIVEKMLAGETV